jgi:hypothetical protein
MLIIPLVLNQAPGHERMWGAEVQFHSFLALALDGSEWPALPPGENTLCPPDRRLEAGWAPEPV